MVVLSCTAAAPLLMAALDGWRESRQRQLMEARADLKQTGKRGRTGGAQPKHRDSP